MRKSVLVALALTLIAFSCLLVSTRPAAAAVGCTASQCDYESPTQTGCSNDAITAEHIDLKEWDLGGYYGTVQLRYSPTCRTAWAKVIMPVPDGYDVLAKATLTTTNANGQRTLGCNVQLGNPDCETNMFYDHSDTFNVTSTAYGQITFADHNPVLTYSNTTSPPY
jgi:hypothetical protein